MELIPKEAETMAVTCAKCGAEFDSQDQLDTHVREEHEAAPRGGFICKTCGMEFGSQEELDAHAKAEHGA
jgi:DNA-directed RNA polymerase subunit RPC12/RpoP